MEISEQLYNDFRQGRIDSLYHEAYASMAAFAARYLADKHALLVEDCVQEAIEKAYRTRTSINNPSQLKVYLYTCIRNRCVSLLRKTNSRAKYIAQQDTTEDERLSVTIIEQETLDLLHRAISELPEKYQVVFELSFEKGLSYADAAQRLGITIDGYNKRKAKMISLLRKRFKENGEMQMLSNKLAPYSLVMIEYNMIRI